MAELPDRPPEPGPAVDAPAAGFVHEPPGPDHPEVGGRVVACTCHPGRR